MNGARSTVITALGAGAALIWATTLPDRYDCLWIRIEAYLQSPERPTPRIHVDEQVHDLGVRTRERFEHTFEFHNDGQDVLEINRGRPN